MDTSMKKSLLNVIATKCRCRSGVAAGAGWVAAGLAALFLSFGAMAAGYPNKTIRLVVPFSPGGSTDTIGRLVAGQLSKQLGQPVIVENRPGGGTVIGMQTVLRADADGYTLLLGSVSTASASALHPKMGFEPDKVFTPVTILARGAYVLGVNPSFPAHSVKELIAYAKAHPGKVNFASAGVGSTTHLAAELFKDSAQINIVHVPYKGAGPAVIAVMSGQVPMLFGGITEMLPQIKAGKLRGLAVTSAKRSALAPNLPTMEEAGLPGYDVTGWYALLVRSETPKAVITTLYDATKKALHSPSVLEQLAHHGVEVGGDTPDVAAHFFKSEVTRWGTVIRKAGIKTD
jgi:tripartite-type tricarboxylate transporter receptor subunit TctC